MKLSTLSPRSRPPLAPILLGGSDREDADRRFGVWLVWFMRALALGWMAQGLLNWALVLLGPEGAPSALEGLTDLAVAVVVFFAVLDLIAAVGLWLTAAWGGVVWLVAVAAQWFTLVMLPGVFPFETVLSSLDLVLVAGYFTLTYKAATEVDE